MLKSIATFFMDIINGSLSWISVVWNPGAFPEWYWLWVTFVLSVILLASGFLAATIAEFKGHQMKYHFLLGIVAPYVYPFILFGNMKKQKKIEIAESDADKMRSTQSYILAAKLMQTTIAQEAEKQAKMDAINEKRGFAVQPREEPLVEPETMAVINPANATVDSEKFNRSFFEKLSVDANGNRVGPFQLTLKDRNCFITDKIKVVQDDLVIFEMSDKNGEIKNIRIKFVNIESCELIPQSGN
jgi:hypothetical protein